MLEGVPKQAPVPHEEAVRAQPRLHRVQRGVEVGLRARVRALARREARAVHAVVDLRRVRAHTRAALNTRQKTSGTRQC